MNQRLTLAAAVLGSVICAGLALGLVISGQVFVPGGRWARGYVVGIPAYSMAFAWLALGAALLFAGCMRAFPSSYFHNRRRRDIALVIFGLAFVFTVVGFIIDRGSCALTIRWSRPALIVAAPRSQWIACSPARNGAVHGRSTRSLEIYRRTGVPDLTVISTALGGLKAATDIARFLRESDLSLEKAELKMRLADLISALAETKMGLAEVQETLAEKDRAIADLKLALESKEEVVRRYDAYYKKDENGDPVGVAFCLRCWESDHKLRQLVYDTKDFRNTICPSCGQKYEGRRSGPLKPGEAAAGHELGHLLRDS